MTDTLIHGSPSANQAVKPAHLVPVFPALGARYALVSSYCWFTGLLILFDWPDVTILSGLFRRRW